MSMSTGQAPGKSSFSQRCSLLSRYLKEKGSFGDINIGLARKSDLELAGKLDLKGQQNVIKSAETSKTRPFDVSQKFSIGEASTSSRDKAEDANINEPAKVVPVLGNPQLTIFFGGKVMVFNEFPEDKAKEIMEVAKEASQHVPVESKNIPNQMDLVETNITSNKSNVVIPDLNEPTNSGNNEDDQTGEQHQVVERIARRASLHRFFAKRKERAVARAPYQVNQNGGHLPPKPEMLKAGQSSRHFETPSKPEADNHMPMEMDKEKGQSSKDLELKL